MAFTSNEMSVYSAEMKTATENSCTADNYFFGNEKGGNFLPPGEVYQCYYSAITQIRVHNTESPRAMLFKMVPYR